MKTTNKGYALLTALMFLLILTTLGVMGMSSSSLEYRMGTNAAFSEKAFQSSEGGRSATVAMLEEHIHARGWDGVAKPSGMTIKDKNNDDKDDMLFLPAGIQASTENVQDTSSIVEDVTYDQGQLKSSIAVVQVATLTNKGAGSAQLSGYQSLGKSASVGGFSTVYEVRSTGKGGGNASAVIASNYRLVPR